MNPSSSRSSRSSWALVTALCLGSIFSASGLKAQSQAKAAAATKSPVFDATSLREPTDLDVAPWLVHGGDDPAYARPDFDDSHWTPFDPRTSLKTVFRNNHPEIVWYRLRLKVPPNQTGLGLVLYGVSFALELYANGQRIVQSGQVAPFKSYTETGHLLLTIPDSQVATGTVVLALRVHISVISWDQLNPAMGATSLTLGQQDSLLDHAWLKIIGANLLSWISSFSGLGLGMVALALFISQRRQSEYFWIFLQSLLSALQLPVYSYQLFHNIPSGLDLVNQAVGLAAYICIILMYFAFLRIPFGRWMQALMVLCVLGYLIGGFEISSGHMGYNGALVAFLPLILLMGIVLPALLIIHFRRGNREAGILLIPVLLYSLNLYIGILVFLLGRVPAFADATARASKVLYNLHAGPLLVSLSTICDLLYALSLAIIIVLRSTRMSRQQAELEGEIAAAREVQQVLVPETISALPGYTLTSAYRPAQEVGGDFFQIVPVEDGSTLVVLGDVSGKGLPAAMAVSLIVGAIRTVAETTSSPAEILACLNRRLFGRLNGGFSTAIAIRLDSDGACTIASAGHPAPFLNNRAIDLPGALPLGLTPSDTYQEFSFVLGETDRLALYTDGLLEARSKSGELYSFDRLKALFATGPTAAQATEAAVDFGQEDDITVLTLTRLAHGQESTALYTAPTLAPA